MFPIERIQVNPAVIGAANQHTKSLHREIVACLLRDEFSALEQMIHSHDKSNSSAVFDVFIRMSAKPYLS
jgi:hypothetical protein